jgi:molybdopterin/thiamine biosynthesis adenylyltransferase
MLPEFGVNGQEKLMDTSVLIIGAGGLGVVVASYLSSMGIGRIGICDFDSIEESNLHRQFLYTPEDIGRKKSTVLSKKLKLQNPGIQLVDFNVRLNNENVESIFETFQIICDCTDNLDSRFLIDKFCKKGNKTLIHGAVSDWQGYLTVFHYKKDIGLSDAFHFEHFLKADSCTINGINSPVCGIIGSYMSNEVIKIILQLENVIEGELIYFNSLNNIFRTLSLIKN